MNEAPIVIIDTMPNTMPNTKLNATKISHDEFRSMVENGTDNGTEILVAIGNQPDFNSKLSTLVPGYDFDACDGYHRAVESFCTWVWVAADVIYYVSIA